MKLLYSSSVLTVALLLATVAVGHEDEDHDHSDMELCEFVNVTDSASCSEWCGSTMVAEWTYVTGHGHLEEMDVDYLAEWECHCESDSSTAVARSGEEDGDAAFVKLCFSPYDLPTCQSVGMADCGENATMTCGELCDQVGLGLGGSTAIRRNHHRRLDHVTDEHFCDYHVAADHAHFRRDRRELHGDEEHGATTCFCNADVEFAAGATIACADTDLLADDHDHDAEASFAERRFGRIVAVGSGISIMIMVASLISVVF